MHELTTINLTMSSAEIAELCDKNHSHVIRDIRAMIEALGDDPDLVHVQEAKDSRGYTSSINLPKDLTLTLVAGYNVKLRKRIIDRWLELEARPAQHLIPQTLPEALRLAADLAEQKAQVEAQLAIAIPKVEALDRIATADGSICISTAAKLLQVRPKDAFSWLSAHRWIFKRHGGSPWLGYQDKLQQGLLEMKVDTVERSDGTQKTVESVLVTPKGLTRLAEMLGMPMSGNSMATMQ